MNLTKLELIISDLQLLATLDKSKITQLSTFASDYILQGIDVKGSKQFAHTIQADPSQVISCVSGIAAIFIHLSESKAEVIAELQAQLPALVYQTLLETYDLRQNQFKEVFQNLYPINACQYKSLSWRVESELASRSQQQSLTPRVLLKLDLDKNGHAESVLLSSDIPNIAHWSKVVDEALSSARSQNARKIQRLVS